MTRLKRLAWMILVLGAFTLGVPIVALGIAPDLGYRPPAPGSYQLPPIKQAIDGDVLDTEGNRRRLFDYMGGRIVLLSFIYAACRDTCPLATYVLHRLASALRQDSALARAVRLITLSFDPVQDTPEVMRRYGQTIAGEVPGWIFLTTPSQAELQPILEGYGQYVVRERDADGRETGAFAHILKVFLIDPECRVRNIYSTSFLHPQLLINDIRTLLLEEKSSQAD
jgi:cytochrome c peroxidase